MIIFKSTLTTVEAIVIFEAAGTVLEIDSNLNPNRNHEF